MNDLDSGGMLLNPSRDSASQTFPWGSVTLPGVEQPACKLGFA